MDVLVLEKSQKMLTQLFMLDIFVFLLHGCALVGRNYGFSYKKLDIIERIGLNMGMSIALVCLDAFVLISRLGNHLLPLVLTISLLTVILAKIAFLVKDLRCLEAK